MRVLPETLERIQRYQRAFQGQADRVPILAQMNEHAVKLYGGDMREYYTDAAKFVEMNLHAHQYYALDMPGFYYDIYNIEAEALGQSLNWASDRMPDIDRQNPLLREHGQLEHLQPPDFKKSGRMPFVLEIMKRCHDLGLPVRIRFCSPFSLAVNLRGIEALLLDILTEPQFVHRLLTFLTDEVLIPWVQAQREAIGQPRATANGADAAASPPIVSLQMLEEFAVSYVRRMNEQIGGVGSTGYWGSSYLAGRPEKFRRMLEAIAAASPGLLAFRDPDLAQAGLDAYVDFAVEKNMPLLLGLDSHLLQEGPIANIVERCRRYVLGGARAGRLIFSFNDIAPDTPPGHVHAAIAAVRHFGRYPIEDRPLGSFRFP